MITDIIDREIKVDDYVVFYNNIYKVLDMGVRWSANGGGYVKIKLAKPSPSTKPVRKYSKEMCILHKEDVLIWILKGN